MYQSHDSKNIRTFDSRSDLLTFNHEFLVLHSCGITSGPPNLCLKPLIDTNWTWTSTDLWSWSRGSWREHWKSRLKFRKSGKCTIRCYAFLLSMCHQLQPRRPQSKTSTAVWATCLLLEFVLMILIISSRPIPFQVITSRWMMTMMMFDFALWNPSLKMIEVWFVFAGNER